MSAGHLSEQEHVLHRLGQQRQQIYALLMKNLPTQERPARQQAGNFPRSQTMRLLLSEPMLMAGISALAVRLLGHRAMDLLRVVGAAFRAGRGIIRRPTET